MAHRVTTEKHGDRTVYTLHDDASGASASVHPSFGFNLFDLRLPVAGEVRPLIASDPGFAAKPSGPSRNGNPILFPFPNRIDHAQFTFQGKTYEPPKNSGEHAIHGFATAAAWDVVGQSTEGGAASLTGRFQISMNAPEMLAHWPTDGVIQVTFALSGRRLTMTTTVSNPSAHDLPYGFGIHPYFYCPFTPGGDPSRTKVVLPASEYWPLEGYIPTGKRLPVGDRLDFRKGQPMKGLKLDDVLTGVAFEGDHAVCRLVDLGLNAEFRLGMDRNFREIVAFTPPWEPRAIAVEPYTQTTDAVNLASKGVDGGLRVLGHGKSHTMVLTMETVG